MALTLSVTASVTWADDREEPEVNAPIRVLDAVTTLENGLHLLDADIEFSLDGELLDALANGVTLSFEINIEIHRDQAWFWERAIASLTQRYQLEYHALSGRYLVTHPVTGIQTGFSTPSAALHMIGTVRGLPLIDAALLDEEMPHQVRLRARMAVDALPIPLRIRSYLDEAWRPASDWYIWPLR